MESFFHTLKTELVHHRTYTTHDQARRDLLASVEAWCNHQRLHLGLGYQTLAEAEHSITTPQKPSRITIAHKPSSPRSTC